jgi:hypothetical protein
VVIESGMYVNKAAGHVPYEQITRQVVHLRKRIDNMDGGGQEWWKECLYVIFYRPSLFIISYSTHSP